MHWRVEILKLKALFSCCVTKENGDNSFVASLGFRGYGTTIVADMAQLYVPTLFWIGKV